MCVSDYIIKTEIVLKKKKGGNELYRIEQRGDDESNYGSESIDAFILSAGITANYKLSRNCFLLLNVNYIQPLGRFTYRKYVTDLYTGEKVERGVYKSSTFARDLNVSVGFGFPFYLGRKTNRKSSHRERTRQLMEQKRKTYGLFPGNKQPFNHFFAMMSEQNLAFIQSLKKKKLCHSQQLD